MFVGGSQGAADYDEEARKLWARLDATPGNRFNNLDPLHRSQEGGFIYVGGDLAARDLEGLKARGVTGVVNCTTNIQCFHKGVLEYHTFDISRWRWDVGRPSKTGLNTEGSPAELAAFLKPVIAFISQKIYLGESVLVHCLAGAHRAGTTGIISLMHFQGLGSTEAVARAKLRRPVIEPIGDFGLLLGMCDKLPRDQAGQFLLA